MISALGLLLSLALVVHGNNCIHRLTEHGQICVCNATYCDTVPELGILPFQKYKLYFTSDIKLGFNTETGSFSKEKLDSTTSIKVNTGRFQKIVGFGGAFTDATGINIDSLPDAARRKLMETYFGTDGIGYSLCRVPMGGTDFSIRPYSYDEFADDVELEQFQLQFEDLHYKIPYIKEAKTLRGTNHLNLFTSAWTAPPWMKTHDIWNGFSRLRREYYQLWADYAVKFFREYQKHGITFWGMTTGNEPLGGFLTNDFWKINSMGWTPVDQSKWIRENLGPTIRESPFKDIKIIIHDDNRNTLPFMVPPMLDEDATLEYIDGVGVHWYLDNSVSPEVLNLVKTEKKDIFLLPTEACYFREGLVLGSWQRAAGYIRDIIENLEYGAVGWLDWNMALNVTGGHTYINYESDGPIIVNADDEEFYKNPMFYAMGHFSKFVIPGSIRLDVAYRGEDDIRTVAFQRPDDLKVVIIFNNGSKTIPVQVEDHDLYSTPIKVQGNSIYTMLYPDEEAIRRREEYYQVIDVRN